jgi:hypothetical protein
LTLPIFCARQLAHQPLRGFSSQSIDREPHHEAPFARSTTPHRRSLFCVKVFFSSPPKIRRTNLTAVFLTARRLFCLIPFPPVTLLGRELTA